MLFSVPDFAPYGRSILRSSRDPVEVWRCTSDFFFKVIKSPFVDECVEVRSISGADRIWLETRKIADRSVSCHLVSAIRARSTMDRLNATGRSSSRPAPPLPATTGRNLPCMIEAGGFRAGPPPLRLQFYRLLRDISTVIAPVSAYGGPIGSSYG